MTFIFKSSKTRESLEVILAQCEMLNPQIYGGVIYELGRGLSEISDAKYNAKAKGFYFSKEYLSRVEKFLFERGFFVISNVVGGNYSLSNRPDEIFQV